MAEWEKSIVEARKEASVQLIDSAEIFIEGVDGWNEMIHNVTIGNSKGNDI